MWLKNFYRSASRLVKAKIPNGKKIGLRHVKYKKRQNAIKKFRKIETAGKPQLGEVLFFKMLNYNGGVNPFQVSSHPNIIT